MCNINADNMPKQMVSKLIECLDLHCLWCCDCDFDNNPDVSCQFGELWKELKKHGVLKK